eukprot:gnl/Trimastix_PCT/2313.p1 GENE.gnl/Trimastix_PCT/2313~~gnl/Trimastix_PCT/2313.p1  ORF type:complete len:458 (+),score=104.68 gnl/Trimastix_PCT/2313:827-2200(+)
MRLACFLAFFAFIPLFFVCSQCNVLRSNRQYPQWRTSCSMETCFNYSLCWGRPFKIHVYPKEPGPYFESSTKKTERYRFHAAVFETLRNSSYHTDNPDEACLFIPAMPQLLSLGVRRFNAAEMRDILQEYPLWVQHEGRNHILFEFGDDAELPYDGAKEHAMVARSCFTKPYFRAGFDVALPLPQKWYPPAYRSHVRRAAAVFQDQEGSPESAPTPGNATLDPWAFYPSPFLPVSPPADDQRTLGEARETPYLMTFKGRKYNRMGLVRQRAHELFHNGKDVVILLICEEYCHPLHPRPPRDPQRDLYTYDDLLLNTTFSLCLEGSGKHSFRILEVLASGSIPILVADDYVLPYSDVIDWRKFSISLPASELPRLVDYINAIPLRSIQAMRRRAYLTWWRYFRGGLPGHALLAIEQIRERIYFHQDRLLAAPADPILPRTLLPSEPSESDPGDQTPWP